MGRRASKSNGKLYWYGAGDEILAETDASGNNLNEYIFFGGKRVALLPAGATAQYYVQDYLGSSRIVTTYTGVVCYDSDFYPYGGERPLINSCAQNDYKFEGKERDAESGNDDFGARYYSNRFGRWLSADWSAVPVPVPYANLSNPQTLNLYSMVDDDPESFADLNGHCSGTNANCQEHSQGADQATTATPQAQSAYQKYIDQETRPVGEADKANALVQAGKEADVGVKAALVITSPQYVVMGAAAAVEAAPAVSTAATQVKAAVDTASISVYVRVTTAASSVATAASTAVTNAGEAINNAVARVAPSPAFSNAQSFLKGVSSTTSQIPQNWSGIGGRAVRLVYEVGKHLLH